MVEKQNIGKEEERVIQRCTKIVRFPERVRVVCVCMYVCVCVTLDRYGYRLFTVVAWSDKSTEPEFYRLHATLPGPALYTPYSHPFLSISAMTFPSFSTSEFLYRPV